MNQNPPHLLLVGCGAMGSAMLQGWERIEFSRLSVITPHKSSLNKLPENPSPDWYASPEDCDINPDIVLFAVKPQILQQILPLYKKFVSLDTLFLSVAAGQPLKTFADHLGEEVAVIRCMPNLPVAQGMGMVVVMDNSYVSSHQRHFASLLFSELGSLAWIDKESWFSIVTAISGSGPAYFYLMVQALGQAAGAAGLPDEFSQLLARQTLIGAASELVASTRSALDLKQSVTSPQGVTSAALEILEDPKSGLTPLIKQAIDQAIQRAIELGQ